MKPLTCVPGASRLLLILSVLLAGLMPAVVRAIDVYPATATCETDATRQYVAYVPLNPSTVQWLVNDVVNGNDTVGKITAAGVYTAPATVPTPNVVTIKCRSTAFANQAGTATLTLTRKYPYLWSTYPASVSVGAYQIALNGANFAPDSMVLVNGVAVPSVYASSTKLTVNGTASAVGTLQVAVKQPGAGSVTGNSVALNVTAAVVTVKVAPAAASVLLGSTQLFTSAVTGSSNPAVTWSIASGAGAIDASSGLYTAPLQMPASANVVVKASSNASPGSFATATVTLQAPPPPPIVVSVSPSNVNVQLGKTQTFTSTVTGTSNTAVSWSIASGGGSIDATTGVYTAPATMPANTPNVAVRARSLANPNSMASATLKLVPAPFATVSLHNARFLEQSSFGPTPATLAEVEAVGIEQYLTNQFEMDETVIPTPPTNSMSELQQWCLYNYTTSPDQLRQRVAYSLSQILVTSHNKLIYPDAMLPWLKLLSKHAFGNYRDLLRDITLCPSMGKYLDLAFSAKPAISGAANENYARELMQLFTIGLWKLNTDGTQMKGSNNQPIPTYTQDTVEQVSLALTGWVYANNAYENFGAPMVPSQGRHDLRSKTFLGTTLPAGQTVEQDLEGVLTCLMEHPNTAPFIATRLIRSLVKSNPSPAYVQRVAAVFENNGDNERGDLKAVVTAILLDQEARNDVPDLNAGRLKEPLLNVAGLLRALNGRFNSTQGLTYLFDYIGQSVLGPPSVFNWFSPMYRLPSDPALFGPEFQIYSPTDSSLRGNFFHIILNNPGSEMVVDLTPFQPYGHDMPGLVEAVNQTLLYGRMPDGMKTVLINAATPGYDARTRIETVLYLTALSGQFAVQH